MDLIRIDASGIHNRPSFIRLAGFRMHFVASRQSAYPIHFCMKEKLYAVHAGIFRQRDVQFKRTYDASGGRINRRYDCIGKMGLHLP